MSTPTALKLRSARVGLGLSQDELAAVLREQHGVSTASKRNIQRWESGRVVPGRHYARALAAALGVTPDDLGLPPVVEDADGARHVRAWAPFTPPAEPEGAPASDGRLPGLWLSRYQYWSTGRGGLFISQYHCVLTQDGARVTVESLPVDAAPKLRLDLTAEGNVLTGQWDEQTDPHGHYLGDRRWGALQFLMTPSHRYMYGKWVGWGSGQVINSGPWELTWISADTSAETLAPYARTLDDEPVE